MGVSSTTNKVIYTGSGTSTFDFDFPIFVSSDLVVEKYTIADGTTTTLVINTDYTVSIDPDGTGTVTTTSPVTSSYKLIIRRVLDLTQEIDYVENDPFPADTHEEGLDRAVMRDQQLQEQIDRSILQDVTQTTQITLPGAVEGAVLGWESSTLVNKTLSDLGAVAKATQVVAEAASNDTDYMTPLQTKNLVQKSGAYTLPWGNMPGAIAFFATMSGNQTINASTDTVVQFNTETFDTNNNYDTTTYKFTPTVAGYYLVGVAGFYGGTVDTKLYQMMVRKNGSNYAVNVEVASGTNGIVTFALALVYMNGTTDYVEGATRQNDTSSATLSNTSGYSYFWGVKVI